MITPSFGLTATERVLPKLALDFTTASLDPRVTFTRTTGASNPATYVNSSGVITAATDNQPRFDYDSVTLACKGLLIEESRTNTLTYSEDFATTWALTGATISTNVTTAPDGTATADKVIATAANAFHFVYKFPTTPAGCTVSVFMKAAEYTSGSIYLSQSGNNGAVFNLSTGVVTSVTGTGNTATISAAGNGWYRCTVTNSGTPNNIVRFGPNNGALTNFVGDGTSGVYIWGAQLEAGAFATSYIPTTTTALTRNADVATMTGTNFSSWYNATEGAFAAQSVLRPGVATGFPTVYAASDGTTNNYITASYGAATPSLGFTVRVSNTNVANMFQSIPALNGVTTSNNCGAYKANSFATSSNATAVSTDSAGAIPTVDRLTIGVNPSLTGFFNGWIQNVKYWPQRLTNSEVQAFAK